MPSIDELSRAGGIADADELALFSKANGSTRKITAPQLAAYVKKTIEGDPDETIYSLATEGDSFTVAVLPATPGGSAWAQITLSTPAASGTVILPGPEDRADGQEVLLTCTAAVSAFAIEGRGASVFGAPSSMPPNGSLRLRYDLLGNAWFMVGDGGVSGAEAKALGDALQLPDYAALRAYSGPRKSVYVTGAGIAGMFVLDAVDATTADNGGTVIVAAGGKRFKREFNGMMDVRWFGAKCNGVADDAQALVAADSAAVSAGATLLITGTPLIKQALVFTGKSNWRFAGGSGTLGSDKPQSHLIKHASVQDDFLTFTGPAVRLENPALLGQAGNAGAGLVLWGHSPQVLHAYVAKMGGDGIRIGRDTKPSNVNCFYITNPRCLENGRHGIHISDNIAAAPDANSGSIINPTCNSNGSHGIYGDNAYLGVTIICPTCQTNGGYGMYLTAKFRQNVILGGDLEVNTTGNLYQDNPLGNIITGLSVQGKTINTRAQLVAFTPSITGSTTAGSCTYTARSGEYEVSGATVLASFHIAYNSHTGAGQPYIPLPVLAYASTPNMVYSPVQVVTSGITLAAGAQVVGLLNKDGGRIQLYTNNAGALAPLNLPASGEFYIRASYPLNAPNFFTL